MSKKVLLSVNTSWNVYNFRKNLVDALIHKGLEVHIFAGQDEYTDSLKKSGYNIHTANFSGDSISILSMYKLYKQYEKIFKEIKPDFYLPFTIKPNIIGSIVARRKQIKTFNNIAGMGRAFDKGELFLKLLKRIYKYSLNKSDIIFFQNKDDRNYFHSNNMIERNKSKLLPGSGVDLKRFKYKQISNKNVFLMASRLLKEKGVYEFIQLAQTYNSLKNKFILAGSIIDNDSSYITKEELRSWVNSGVIEYRGMSDNIEDLIYESTCVILPSFYREGVPRILLESAACGRPIITTNITGCKEVIKDNGFLAVPRSYNSLEECFNKYSNLSYEDKIKMGLASRVIVEKNFSESKIIDSYLKVCK